MTKYCPLGMITGNKVACEHRCSFCPPEDMHEIGKAVDYFQYFQCLNYPDDMFGTGMANSGLGEIADAIGNLASAVEGDE